MSQRYALSLCGLVCLAVVTSLVTVNLAAQVAPPAVKISKMTLFDLPPSYGRSAVDIPNLNERGPSNLVSVQGAITIPVRYQIKTTTTFADASYRLVVKFFEPCSACGESREGASPPEPIGEWTSPMFDTDGKLHINEATPLVLPCPPGVYRIRISIERYFEGVDRVRGPIAEWQVQSARVYPDVVVK